MVPSVVKGLISVIVCTETETRVIGFYVKHGCGQHAMAYHTHIADTDALEGN